jgi:hypothetical protein
MIEEKTARPKVALRDLSPFRRQVDAAQLRFRGVHMSRNCHGGTTLVFMRQNDGFRILYLLIKDALMYRLGAVTVDLEEYSEKPRISVHRLLMRTVIL